MTDHPTMCGWGIRTYRGGTHDSQCKDVAAVLEVPIDDSADPSAARSLRKQLETEGWRKGRGSEMRISTGDMST